MFKSKHLPLRQILYVGVLVATLLSVAGVASAKEVITLPASGKSSGVVIYEGDEAITRYAKISGLSEDEVRQLIATSRAQGAESESSPVVPMGAGGHFSVFVPSCTYYNGGAFALYETGTGPHTVQFSGTVLGTSGGNCAASACTFMASMPLPFPGDEVWTYFVTAGWSNDISHWCGGIA